MIIIIIVVSVCQFIVVLKLIVCVKVIVCCNAWLGLLKFADRFVFLESV